MTQEPNPPHTRVSDARTAFAMLSPEDRKALMKPQYQIKLPYRWRQFQEGYADLVTRRVPLVQSTPEGLVVNATLYGDMISCFGSEAGERAARDAAESAETTSCRVCEEQRDQDGTDGEGSSGHGAEVRAAVQDYLGEIVGRAHRWND